MTDREILRLESVDFGLAPDILRTELVSECFDHPIEIEHRAGRWQA